MLSCKALWAASAALAFLCGVPGVVGQPAIHAPTPAGVLGIMEKVADWQLANPSSHPRVDWTQGAGDTGIMALAGISGNPRYRDAMLSAAAQAQWMPGPRPYHADDQCVGQTYAELYLLYRDPRMIAPLRTRLDAILEHPSAVTSMDFSQPGARATELWSWCDSLFMGPPTWMRMAAATGEQRYQDFAIDNWWRTTDVLFDRTESLYYRDSTYFSRREANGRKVFWSRGNGWVMAGLVRMLQYLPTNHPERPRFEHLFKLMAEKVLWCQQPDGMWRASLLDPEHYPLREASGSGFFTYALAWGVNQGLLERVSFEPAVLRAWEALVACVEPSGRLGHVQPIGADPKAFSESATEVYGVGSFLLAGSEVYRLEVLEGPRSQGHTELKYGQSRPGRAVVRVTNPAGLHRAEETVEIDASKLGTAARFAVMDGFSSRILDSQVYASVPSRPEDRLLFQVDLAPHETREFTVICESEAGDILPAVPRPITKTYARQVPERFNDMAWESDRIAHRMYQLELIRAEGTLSSGIDVWVKRTRGMVVDEWYARGDYHEDHGDGLDDYRVGRSRGCGGLGVWAGGRLYVSSNFRDARVITTGPVRSEFELTYDAWDAGGRRVSERKRISIDAGSNLSRAESVFESDDPTPLSIAVGIAQRAGGGDSSHEDLRGGWMTYWQAPDRDRGNIGCAVLLLSGPVTGFALDTSSFPAVPPEKQLVPDAEGLPAVSNLVAITQVPVGMPLVYYFGAAWTKSGDFPDEGHWIGYIRQFAQRRNSPLRVVVSATEPPK